MLTKEEYLQIEEIIWQETCGIDLDNLNDNQVINPDKVIINRETQKEIINKIEKEIGSQEYDNLNIRMLLMNIGPDVREQKEDVKLLDNHIIRKEN